MPLPLWVRHLTHQWLPRASARRPRTDRPRARFGVECLEDRLTPATVNPVLVFTTAPQTNLVAGQPSAAFTVQLQDPTTHSPVAATADTFVSLSSSSPTSEFLDAGGHTLLAMPGVTAPGVFITAGTSSVSFEYVDANAGSATPGTPTLTASAAGIAPATQQEKVTLPGVITVTTASDNTTTPIGGSLRDAIGTANAASGPSVIVFDPSVTGTVTLAGDLPAITNNVTILGPGAGKLTVQGGNPDVGTGKAVLSVAAGGAVTVDDLSFSDSGGTALAVASGASLTLQRVTVSGSGEAVYSKGTLTADAVTVQNGTGFASSPLPLAAGVQVAAGTATVLNSTFTGNGRPAVETGTDATAVANVTYSAVTNGTDTGLANEAGTMTLKNVLVSGNHATGGTLPPYGDPGGVLNASGALTITGSTIANNSTSGTLVAGGIDSEGGTLTITNSTVYGNVDTNSNSAGGIGVYGGTATFTNDTVSGNTATQQSGTTGNTSGGGIDAFGTTVTIANTIVAGNTGSANNPADVAGTFTSHGNNLIGLANSKYSSGFGASDQVGTGTPIDPRLGPLANNGGPTPTLALLTTPGRSPAIDAGGDANAPATDQRGVARPQGSSSDVGAFELLADKLALSPASIPSGTVGTAYNQSITASQGSGTTTVSYAVTSGSVPAGLTFTRGPTDLTIAGTPTGAGSVTFQVAARDSANTTVSQTYTLTVAAPGSGGGTGGTGGTSTGTGGAAGSGTGSSSGAGAGSGSGSGSGGGGTLGSTSGTSGGKLGSASDSSTAVLGSSSDVAIPNQVEVQAGIADVGLLADGLLGNNPLLTQVALQNYASLRFVDQQQVVQAIANALNSALVAGEFQKSRLVVDVLFVEYGFVSGNPGLIQFGRSDFQAQAHAGRP